MSDRQVVIIHGWSDTSKSFGPLVQFLQNKGYKAVVLWLGDYISLDDDVKIEDVAKRLNTLVQDKITKGELTKPFDMIVHSTGGLVAREWISSYYGNAIAACPVKRLVMLAPANFGSKLASMGQSALGRLIKGWNNWFHTGKEMLASLELSSPYQWNLVQKDLLMPDDMNDNRTIYGEQGIWPFVITGTHPYPGALRQIVNENGSDGTVRVAAANLNAQGVTLDFTNSKEGNPDARWWKSRFSSPVPLAVLPDRTHASIIDPDKGDVEVTDGTKTLGEIILQALNCESWGHYQDISQKWDGEINKRTANLASDEQARKQLFKGDTQKEELFHQYIQVNVRVIDDHGADVTDYFLEFMGPEEDKTDELTSYFHREVMKQVHTNGSNAAYRCLFIDRTELVNIFYNKIDKSLPKELKMSISAKPPGNNISYFANYKAGASGSVKIHWIDDLPYSAPERFHRNSTVFVKIIIPRVPSDDVFKLEKA